MVRNDLAKLIKPYETNVPSLYKSGVIFEITNYFNKNSDKNSWYWEESESLDEGYSFVSFAYQELGRTKIFSILVEN